jgi:hypothetical protein
MKIVSVVVLLFLICPIGFCQKMDFYSESLTFRLQKGQFELDGLYYLRNNTANEIRQALFYPFPDIERYGEISFISITRENDTASMLIKQTDKGALFAVHLLPKQEAVYHIIYRQSLKSNQAKYIILTTQKWGKPFETAEYRLEHPDNLMLTDLSIPPDTSFYLNDRKIYLWQRNSFMPSVDFEFEFE